MICLLLFVGAMGKSAQFLLHTWLPDAMEGPTPVSALIHAATMVTAGVFMVARLSPLFELAPVALQVVTAVGAITAFFAATVGVAQNDIKRVIAYSTCSQLGYMFVAMGVGAYSAGMFHLFTHAFFKALLFLGAGSVIHALHDEQDLRNMGGLRKGIPVTFIMMVIGTLALTGFPFTSGYFSKDMIIEVAHARHTEVAEYAFILLVIAAFLTSFYSWRLIFMAFFGAPRYDEETAKHVHESPLVMLMPLGVLRCGALVAGYCLPMIFRRRSLCRVLAHFAVHRAGQPHPARRASRPGMGGVAADGHDGGRLRGGLSLVHRLPGDPGLDDADFQADPRLPLQQMVFRRAIRLDLRAAHLNGWRACFGRQATSGIIDGLGPDGISARVIDITNRVVRLQTGFVYHYAFVMLIGIALITSYFAYVYWAQFWKGF